MPLPYPDKTNYVFSHSSGNQDTESEKFITGAIPYFVRNLKQEEGKYIWLNGGGLINTQLFNAGLIDQISLTIIPVLLGKEIPLLGKQAKEVKFKMHVNNAFRGGFVQISFKC